MDCSSINMIDLRYLTNPHAMHKLEREKNEKTEVNQEEIEFYKKRIFQIAKDILLKKSVDKKLANIFNIFSTACISHFKFIDKSDAIQKDYENMVKTKKKKKSMDVDTSNTLIMRKKRARVPKITDHIHVTVKNIKKKCIILPKGRDINLKDPKFRTKGIEIVTSKNITIEKIKSKNQSEIGEKNKK